MEDEYILAGAGLGRPAGGTFCTYAVLAAKRGWIILPRVFISRISMGEGGGRRLGGWKGRSFWVARFLRRVADGWIDEERVVLDR